MTLNTIKATIFKKIFFLNGKKVFTNTKKTKEYAIVKTNDRISKKVIKAYPPSNPSVSP